MRTLCPLCALAVFAGIAPAPAMTSFSAQGSTSLRQLESAAQLIARRRVAPYQYRYGGRRYGYDGPQQYRQYV